MLISIIFLVLIIALFWMLLSHFYFMVNNHGLKYTYKFKSNNEYYIIGLEKGIFFNHIVLARMNSNYLFFKTYRTVHKEIIHWNYDKMKYHDFNEVDEIYKLIINKKINNIEN